MVAHGCDAARKGNMIASSVNYETFTERPQFQEPGCQECLISFPLLSIKNLKLLASFYYHLLMLGPAPSKSCLINKNSPEQYNQSLYIYIYMCVCVCVCVCIYIYIHIYMYIYICRERETERQRERGGGKEKQRHRDQQVRSQQIN